jgi:hypothetical protein
MANRLVKGSVGIGIPSIRKWPVCIIVSSNNTLLVLRDDTPNKEHFHVVLNSVVFGIIESRCRVQRFTRIDGTDSDRLLREFFSIFQRGLLLAGINQSVVFRVSAVFRRSSAAIS